MLSYQHIYHAGNRADIHKHLWLITVLQYLVKKDKPIQWIDTHAGRGLYDLNTAEAQKTAEYKEGIHHYYQLLSAIDNLPDVLIFYKNLLRDLNSNKEIITYPGSAYLAAKILRPTDRLYAFDLHKGEFPHLEKSLKRFSHANCRFEDGYKALGALVPPPQRRGGALIDPSYELKNEYADCAQVVLNAYKKWPQGVYMIWYPILKDSPHKALVEPFQTFGLADEDIVIDEWMFENVVKGMIGSGMIILNPPYDSSRHIAEAKNLLHISG